MTYVGNGGLRLNLRGDNIGTLKWEGSTSCKSGLPDGLFLNQKSQVV
jgi:hypothetical protein